MIRRRRRLRTIGKRPRLPDKVDPQQANTAMVFVAIVMLTLIGIAAYVLVVLTERRGAPVSVQVPGRGRRRRLLDLAVTNAEVTGS